jgi:hypothetical protein
MSRKSLRLMVALVVACFWALGLTHLLAPANAAQAAPAAFRYVAVGGQCGSNTPCYASVQVAVDAAGDGDEIRVAAGVYSGVSTRNGETQVLYVDKSVRIRGGYDPNTWVPDPAQNFTVLDAQGQGRALTVMGVVTPTVEGLRLTNGSAQNGGGVYIDRAAVSLRQNDIYSNTATSGWGGGVYAKNSAAVISDNRIYSNTTGSNGRGGGIALSDSPAQVLTNTIRANRAHVGAGVELGNGLGSSGAFLFGNVIKDNTAFDYQYSGYTIDGAGGGVDIASALTDTLRGNVIDGNMAKWGGGIHSFSASPTIEDNTIQENNAPTHGGGLYVQWGAPSIRENRILSNTAQDWGGGMMIWADGAVVANNRFQGNVSSSGRGGGLYATRAAAVDGNVFQDNQAVQGGGIFVPQGSSSFLFRNNAIIGNHASEGGGLYIWGAVVQFVHTTLAGNPSSDGRGVVIDKYPGLVDPSSPTIAAANVTFTNTILVSHTVGIYATDGNTITVDGVLWFNTPTHVNATGAHVTVQHEYTGDPRFESDGYHLQAQYSAALDQGVSVSLDHDVDGELRPMILGRDLGADELPLSAPVTPQAGGILTHTSPFHILTQTVTVPPGAITSPLTLRFTPFPPPPSWMSTSVFSGRIPVGLPFRLTPFGGGLPRPPIKFTRLVTVSVTYSGNMVSAIKPGSQIYAVFARKLRDPKAFMRDRYHIILVDCPSAERSSAGGQAVDTRIGDTITVYLCTTAGAPSHFPPPFPFPPPPRSKTVQNAPSAAEPEADDEFVYFIILGEPAETRLFLPVVRR